MQPFERSNPIPVAIWFLVMSGIAMFCTDPILLLITLLGAVTYFILRDPNRSLRSHLPYLGLFVLLSLINPLFVHKGKTVLFVLNNSPITLEALLYGITSAAMLVSVLYWFRSAGRIFTSEKLLYLFGRFSPKTALVLSMSLRSAPLFARQAKEIKKTQIALGLYKDENVFDRIKGDLRVFSVLLTWALENGIITADSMAARGYGVGRRTHFSRFAWSSWDCWLLLLTLLLGGATVAALILGAVGFAFYPSLTPPAQTPMTFIGYFSYALLALLPMMTEWEDARKWNCLRSEI